MTREDPEVEEDVRRMDSEANDLRRLSRVNDSSSNPDFALPSSTSKQKQSHHHTQLQSLGTPRETPVKGPRENQNRRKSSLGMRGKRISTSFEATGVICRVSSFIPLCTPFNLITRTAHPHNSVSESSFYKHIDCDLPPSARTNQLLIWCSSRAMAKSTKSALDASSKRRSKNPGKEPPLSEKALELLKVVEEDVVRLLAERKIDTSIFSGSFGSNEKKKENAQNVRNRQCQIEYTAQIERPVLFIRSRSLPQPSDDNWFILGPKPKPLLGLKRTAITIHVWLNLSKSDNRTQCQRKRRVNNVQFLKTWMITFLVLMSCRNIFEGLRSWH